MITGAALANAYGLEGARVFLICRTRSELEDVANVVAAERGSTVL